MPGRSGLKMRCYRAPGATFPQRSTMIGRIISQTYRQAGVVGKIHHALHELCPAAVVLRPIVEINDQGREVGKPVRHPFPPPPQTIDQTVTGHFGGDAIQKQFIQRWQEDAHWGHGGVWVKVVVSSDRRDAALATAGTRTDFDARFGIHREA